VVLLRPDWWLEEEEARFGGTVELDVPECGIEGKARVLGIERCPPVKPGAGRVITGTFKHSSARVLDLYVEGLNAPIGTTATHLFWSEDREAFVAAGELRHNEALRTSQGTLRCLAAIPRERCCSVHNIEVQVSHTYHISSGAFLVHNAGRCPVDVTRWGRPGLKKGDWVMKGAKTWWNYIFSGKWQRGLGNIFAPFRSGQTYKVLAEYLHWPKGWEWIKGFLGQRIYKGPDLP
jgi:hypothetical protein